MCRSWRRRIRGCRRRPSASCGIGIEMVRAEGRQARQSGVDLGLLRDEGGEGFAVVLGFPEHLGLRCWSHTCVDQGTRQANRSIFQQLDCSFRRVRAHGETWAGTRPPALKYLSVCSGIEAATRGLALRSGSGRWPFPRSNLRRARYSPITTRMFRCTAISRCCATRTGSPTRTSSWAERPARPSPSPAFANPWMTAGAISPRIREARRCNRPTPRRAGLPPCIVVWENVPGVLSVRDNAFGCFLSGLSGEDAPFVPPRGKWTNAGVALGPARAVAWRILDAQYFGLAQRRRRVFVVASAREGFDPAAVLLEFEGVRRDSPPRRETGKDAAAGTAPGADERRSHWDGIEHPHPTLNQSFNTGAIGYSNQELFSQRGAGLVGEARPARSPTASMPVAWGGRISRPRRSSRMRCGARASMHRRMARGGEHRWCRCRRSIRPRAAAINFPPPDVSPPLKVGSNGGGQPPAIAFSAKDHGADASEDSRRRCAPCRMTQAMPMAAGRWRWPAHPENRQAHGISTEDTHPQHSASAKTAIPCTRCRRAHSMAWPIRSTSGTRVAIRRRGT